MPLPTLKPRLPSCARLRQRWSPGCPAEPPPSLLLRSLPSAPSAEYCARGSLTDVLRGAKTSPAKASQLDWLRRLNMGLDAAKGMLYLHAHVPPIIHR